MSVIEELLAANRRYASAFQKAGLPMRPARQLAVVTCMDARLDPARFLGLEEGDAHVIRNAGAIVNDDVLRSLVLSHELGTQEAVVVGHRNCAALTFGSSETSVRQSVAAIASSPLLPDSFTATGFVYDEETGRIESV